ncbi:Plasmodium exported protein, unknown function [Plasmodium knowlesi strain H]|uniref:Uncharacterized protein n=3 Tax=Plasmodium knowlesi TaxID=5850 RepID=A0A5K1UP39_PLAKH|nr:Plasmodium exported protein, unknown function [Plasmodium knowlesi strain H]OTN66413.1 Uncharacterized protein PKNOH_S09510000 [Plasmodium knowlesi]CAA9986273.1 Plasmodium exported protein, unknown function [Plasmodium knowlesi strain H]SBO25487.1 Plasmodium exported protein, unknown function [Plasmodium knowlesi strain H]SBO28261.1 Plasmodium exported protein, unknown function [Plasmodium knowlesi strain H]VVS75747.1 Plasmodium exported protein, unknown function [Plasmodium knowlesi strain|eukprot:XP_002257681.1 hypothetical protein, conserved in Plasmodium species [Plasmodium knowlesi strain H]
MSNLRRSSASGRNVNSQRCRHSKDESVSTWGGDYSDIQNEGCVKSSLKFLFRSSLFTVLLLAVHWSSSKDPYSEWNGGATNEVKLPRNRRILHNNSGRYMSSNYGSCTETITEVRENNGERRNRSRGGPSQYNSSPSPEQSPSLFRTTLSIPSENGSTRSSHSPSPSDSFSSFASLFSSRSSTSPPFSTPFNSYTAMNNPPPRNNDVWSIYEDGLRYLNDRAFRNMGNDFRYPNNMYNPLNEQNNIRNPLHSNFNNNSSHMFYVFSFLIGVFLLSQLGAQRLLILAAAMGVFYQVRRSIRWR